MVLEFLFPLFPSLLNLNSLSIKSCFLTCFLDGLHNKMNFQLSKWHICQKIQELHPGIGPNLLVFREHADEAFFAIIGVAKTDVTNTNSLAKVEVFLDDFSVKCRAYWNESRSGRKFEGMKKHHKVHFDKIWHFDLTPEPPVAPPIVPPVNDVVPSPPKRYG